MTKIEFVLENLNDLRGIASKYIKTLEPAAMAGDVVAQAELMKFSDFIFNSCHWMVAQQEGLELHLDLEDLVSVDVIYNAAVKQQLVLD